MIVDLSWIKWETKNACPICGSLDIEPYFSKRMPFFTIEAYRCNDCRCVFHNPMMSEESMKRFYKDGAYRDIFKASDELESGRSARLIKLMDENLISPVRALDVGCSRGIFLAMIEERFGSSVLGIELNMKYPGIAAVVSSREFVFGKYDFVSCIHTLEHMYDPVTELAWMTSVLEPQGYLMIEVPGTNILSIAHPYGFEYETLRYILRDKLIVCEVYDKKYTTVIARIK